MKTHQPFTAVVTLLGPALAVLAGSALPAAADPPSRVEQVIVHVNCMAQGAFGAVRLGLEHISTGAGAPGGDVTVWPPNADPETDPPVLGGYNRDITRDGRTLTGEIPLRATGDDIVGWSSYTVTFAHAGPTEVEEVKGPLVEYDMRYNQRYRNEKERTPLVASGVLTLPGAGAVPLAGCAGEEVVEHISMTRPGTVVGAGRYPFGLRDGEICQARSSGATTAQLGVTGGEVAIVILHGEEELVAFGTVFPEMTRSTIAGSVPMFGPNGEELGQATLHATLRVVDRDNPRYRDGATLHIGQVEQVAAEGSIVFDEVTYTFTGCEGVRARERTITR